MDGIDVKSFKELREEKEYLSRELAEACRDYIDLKYKYEEVVRSYRTVKDMLAEKLLETESVASLKEADLKIDQAVDLELMKHAQMKLPLNEEGKS